MDYRMRKGQQELTVEIEGSELDNSRLMSEFQKCREGRCDCPTQEYDKLEGIRIEQDRDRFALHLKPKPGRSINQDAVAACLDHTLGKSTQDPAGDEAQSSANAKQPIKDG